MSDIVVVGVATNGLLVARHEVVEIGWHDLATDEHGVFVPNHDVRYVVANSDIDMLIANGYVERIARAEQDRHPKWAEESGEQTFQLWERLNDATLTAADPGFVAPFLAKLFARFTATEIDPAPWPRALDIEAYGAGVLGLDPSPLPRIRELCERLGIEPGDHTADRDVAAEVAVLRELMRRAGSSAPDLPDRVGVERDEELIEKLRHDDVPGGALETLLAAWRADVGVGLGPPLWLEAAITKLAPDQRFSDIQPASVRGGPTS